MIVERRIPRNGPVMVKLASGEWIPEAEVQGLSDVPAGDSDEEE